MSRRELLLSALLIYAIAVLVRIAAASQIPFPRPEDTAYYVGVARNLVEGRGLVADAIWSYQTPPLVFPRPAFEVWLPLPSFLAAVPMAVFGTSFAAAQVSSVLIGAIVPVLAWRLGADVALELGLSGNRARTMAHGAGLTSAVYLPLVLFSALPDSTILFAVLVLSACLLMPRLARDPRAAGATNPWLIALGVLIGLTALTRNEALWVGLAWAIVAWRIRGRSRRDRVLMIAVPGIVAAAVFAPWAIRDWIVFGNPLPGQALANALSVTGFDIFAWNDPPTLSRYLAVGPARLVEMRVEGITHNLFNVLIFLGVPVAVVGLVFLGGTARLGATRPLLLVSLMTFAVTSLAFPVATTWGTFLHAAGPVHVLLIVSSLVALDRGIAWLARVREWTKPVAWLGAALTIFGSTLFSASFLPTFGGQSKATADTYAVLSERMSEVGLALGEHGPVITNFPIWLAEATPASALALPMESPADVVDLASDPAFPGTTTLVVHGAFEAWPDVLDEGGPSSECFTEVPLGSPADPALASLLEDVRVFRIVCP